MVILQELYFTGTTSHSKLWPAPTWSSQPSSLQDWSRLTIENHHTFTFKPNLYSYLFYF